MSTTPDTTKEHEPEPSSASPPSNPVSLLEAATFFAIDYIDLCQQANISLTQLAETLDDPAYQPTLEKLRRLKKLERQRYQEVITREAIENLRRISLSHPDPTERRRASTTILRAFATTNRPRHKSKSPASPDALRPRSGSASNHTDTQTPPIPQSQSKTEPPPRATDLETSRSVRPSTTTPPPETTPSHQSQTASTPKEEGAGGGTGVVPPRQHTDSQTPLPHQDQTASTSKEEVAGGNILLREHTDSSPQSTPPSHPDSASNQHGQCAPETNTLSDRPSNAHIAELRSKAGTTKPLTKPAPLDDTLPLILPILETLKDANTAAQAMESLHALLTPEQRRIYPDPADYFATHLDILKAFSTTKAVTPTPKHHPALIRDGEDATRNFQIKTSEGDHTLEITFIYTATTDPPWHITTIKLKPPGNNGSPPPAHANSAQQNQPDPTTKSAPVRQSKNDTS